MKRLTAITLSLLCVSAFAQTAPTIVATSSTTFNAGAASKSSTSFTWSINDILVSACGSQAPDTLTVPTTTGSGLTFTSQAFNNAASTSGTRMSTATATAASSGTISVSNSSSSTNDWGCTFWQVRGSTGIGAAPAEGHTSSLTVSMTPVSAHSTVLWAVFDFNAGAVQALNPAPTDTVQNTQIAGTYTVYVADKVDSTTATAWGISGTGAGPFSIVAIELKSIVTPNVTLKGQVTLKGKVTIK